MLSSHLYEHTVVKDQTTFAAHPPDYVRFRTNGSHQGQCSRLPKLRFYRRGVACYGVSKLTTFKDTGSHLATQFSVYYHEFQPSFTDFQKDIERYIVIAGKREWRNDGMMVFWGYSDAEEMMLRRYLDHGAFDPLVAHVRRWNWEVDFNHGEPA